MYQIIKFLARCALFFFCRKITVTNKDLFKIKGPLLLAANHPNSFFDAILLGALFKRPVHFLTRGDAFKKPFARKLLSILKAIPIYRLQEGKEYLSLNEPTFEKCYDILKHGGIILIFSEGLCENQWQLRPLKKGTARIAIQSWKKLNNPQDFRVLPVGINYHSFILFGKNVIIDFGEPLTKDLFENDNTEAEHVNYFNKLLYHRIAGCMVMDNGKEELVKFLLSNPNFIRQNSHAIQEVKGLQQALQHRYEASSIPQKELKKLITYGHGYWINGVVLVLLLIPALLGLIIHLPFYMPLKNYVRKKTNDSVFYDSVLFGLLFITYPVYVILLSFLGIWFFGMEALFTPILILFLAWSSIAWREAAVRLFNSFSASSPLKRMVNKLSAKTII